MAALREVIESPHFVKARRMLPPEIDVKRLDEWLAGAVWNLARRPQDFPKVPKTRNLHYIVVDDPFSSTSLPLCVWYTFDKTTVTLEHIDQDPPDYRGPDANEGHPSLGGDDDGLDEPD
jgi:hypothetical protein